MSIIFVAWFRDESLNFELLCIAYRFVCIRVYVCVFGKRHRPHSSHRSLGGVLCGVLRFPVRCRSLLEGLTGMLVLPLWIPPPEQ